MIKKRSSKQERADQIAIITQGNLCVNYSAVLGDMFSKGADVFVLDLLKERKLYHDNKHEEMCAAFTEKWRKDDSK